MAVRTATRGGGGHVRRYRGGDKSSRRQRGVGATAGGGPWGGIAASKGGTRSRGGAPCRGNLTRRLRVVSTGREVRPIGAAGRRVRVTRPPAALTEGIGLGPAASRPRRLSYC